MKAKARGKIGSQRGNPSYRTPSFFRNRPHRLAVLGKINKVIK